MNRHLLPGRREWEGFKDWFLLRAGNILLSSLLAAPLFLSGRTAPVHHGPPAPARGQAPREADVAPVAASAPAAPGARTVQGTVRAGKGFAENLMLAGLEPELVRELVDGLAPSLNFQRLRVGDRFTVVLDSLGQLVSLTYEKSPLEALVLRAGGAGWETERAAIPVETRVEEIRGTIRGSLFESMERLGEGDQLTLGFVELFAWDIDFSHELQPGDTFRVVAEKIYRDGRFLQYGRILAAEYCAGADCHRAYYFPRPGGTGEYFSPEGASLRASFLRSPLSYTRISSGYSSARLHPILNRVRPHLGVDYAAPAGTPVWAPADGVVVSRGYDAACGNNLVLRHPGGYESHFLHLSRFSPGLRAGTRVRQKEVVAYVGATGLATGPHLDYRLQRRGRWVNPLREEFPKAESLPAAERRAFAEIQAWLDGRRTSPMRTAAGAGPAPKVMIPPREG